MGIIGLLDSSRKSIHRHRKLLQDIGLVLWKPLSRGKSLHLINLPKMAEVWRNLWEGQKSTTWLKVEKILNKVDKDFEDYGLPLPDVKPNKPCMAFMEEELNRGKENYDHKRN